MTDTNNVVLTSADGSFVCTGEHAVEIAHMMSLAGAVADRSSFSDMQIGELICLYLRGNASIEEITKEFMDWFKELEGEETTNADGQKAALEDKK